MAPLATDAIPYDQLVSKKVQEGASMLTASFSTDEITPIKEESRRKGALVTLPAGIE